MTVTTQPAKPASKRDIPMISDRICENLGRARSVAGYLIANGFTVLEVHISPRNPRIVVQPCAQCALLESAMRMRYRVGDVTREVWVANVRGCQVEWTVNGSCH